jgi:NAD(P)H-hydrate epimerase
VEAADVAGWWPRRARRAHKWNGSVRVVAGSASMRGAARLCSEAALRTGAGLVALSVPGGVVTCRDEVIQPPIGSTDWAAQVLTDISRFGALVVGPGLGRTEATIEATRHLIAEAMLPIVVDGDALYAAAWSADGPAPLLTGRTRPTVLTPHDGEYSLLVGSPPPPDRFAATRQLAANLGCTVLLKGPTTIVADPNGRTLVVDRGDERLATAGTGDVLAGMIVTMLASGVEPLQAAAAASWMHAEAARSQGRFGMTAGDIIEALPRTVAAIVGGQP